MKDSMIIYRSFVTAGKKIKNKQQRLAYYEAIFDYGLDQIEPTLDDVADAVFEVVKPQIEANNKRYVNGCKPKAKQKGSKKEAKDKQNESKVEANVNDNVNVNENDNVNDNVNVNENVFGLYETEFKRPLSSSEMIRLSEWLEKYDEEAVTFALRSSIVQGVRDFNYIGRILEVQNPDDNEGDY